MVGTAAAVANTVLHAALALASMTARAPSALLNGMFRCTKVVRELDSAALKILMPLSTV